MTRDGSRFSAAENIEALYNASPAGNSPPSISLLRLRSGNAPWRISFRMDWMTPNAGPGSIVPFAKNLPVLDFTLREGALGVGTDDDSRGFNSPLMRGGVIAARGQVTFGGTLYNEGLGNAAPLWLRAWATPGAPRIVERQSPLFFATDLTDWAAQQAATSNPADTRVPWRATSVEVLVNDSYRGGAYVPVAPEFVQLYPNGTFVISRVRIPIGTPVRIPIDPACYFAYIEDPTALALQRYMTVATFREVV